MWKFKKEVTLSIGLSIIILIYTFLIKDKIQNIESFYTYMLKDYTFMFIFSSILFYLLLGTKNAEQVVFRFKKIMDFIFFEIKKTFVSLVMFFLILTINQIIIFTIFDPLLKIEILLYRNIILLWLILLFYLVILVGKRKNNTKKVILLFLVWNILYIIFILFPQNMINDITVFKALRQINIYEIIRLAAFTGALILIEFMKIDSMKRNFLE